MEGILKGKQKAPRIFQMVLKKRHKHGAGEMAQLVRTLVAFSEDQSSIAITHVVPQNHLQLLWDNGLLPCKDLSLVLL